MMLLAFEMNLLGGGLDFCTVVETGVPVAAALRASVHEGARWEVAQSAVGIAREHGNGGVLMPFAVFAA